MSLKTVGTALTRTLWTTGNRTPPVARSPKVNRLSTTCRVSGGREQRSENAKEQSCGSVSDRPSVDVQSSSEPPFRRTAGDKKQCKEPVGAPGVTGVRRRSYTSNAAPMDQRSYLWARYNDMKRLVHGKHRVPPTPPSLPAFLFPRLPHTAAVYVTIHVTKTPCSQHQHV